MKEICKCGHDKIYHGTLGCFPFGKKCKCKKFEENKK